MNKVLSKYLASLFVILACVLVVPFHITYADTLTSSNIIGVNFECVDITPIESTEMQAYGNTYQRCIYTFHFQCVLDKEYYGYITGRFQGTYQTYDPSTQSGSLVKTADSYNRSFYVCGNSFDYYMQTQQWIEINQLNSYTITYANQTFTLAGSVVHPFGYQDSLDTISQNISDMLIEEQNISSYLYDSTNGTILEQVVTTNSLIQLAGQYFLRMVDLLEYIDLNVSDIEDFLNQYRQYNFPIESLTTLVSAFQNASDYITGIYNLNYYSYPIFTFDNANRRILRSYCWKDSYLHCIFISLNFNVYSPARFFQKYRIYDASNSSYLTDSVIKNFTILSMNGESNIYAFDILLDHNANIYLDSTSNNIMIPIYVNSKTYTNVSTDFALLFGLNNSLLENLNKIANGTTQSNQSSSSLDSQSSQFESDAQQMYSYENTFNSDMNTNLNNINTNFDIGNQLGSKFMYSATWVKTQFDNITNGTPFGTILSFSLLLGIAMLLIGKAL